MPEWIYFDEASDIDPKIWGESPPRHDAGDEAAVERRSIYSVIGEFMAAAV